MKKSRVFPGWFCEMAMERVLPAKYPGRKWIYKDAGRFGAMLFQCIDMKISVW